MKHIPLTLFACVLFFTSFSQTRFTSRLSDYLFAKSLLKPGNIENKLNGNIDPCATWVVTPTTVSYLTAGDIDITGNQLTVEASFNRSSLFDNSFGLGDVVSKQTDSSHTNYSLMPAQCAITTDVSGYVTAVGGCTPTFNKTYHVALVYDGLNLSFYRNGFLLAQTPCTGNLLTNDLLTTIGQVAGTDHPDSAQFKGYINEVRIWNVARSQAQIQANMNTTLTDPATQTGLLAYYTFDGLINKQGNTAYNATINGGAAINASNLNCPFVADSCIVVLPVTLTSFETSVAGKQIKLNWQTENEDGTRSYTIERSVTGNTGFIKVGAIEAANSHFYLFVDSTIEPGKAYYYRLAILGVNGSVTYSDIKLAKASAYHKILIIYPNPSKGNFLININGYTGMATFTVTNSTGQVVLRKTELMHGGEPIQIMLGNHAKGTYWLKVITRNEKTIERIVLF